MNLEVSLRDLDDNVGGRDLEVESFREGGHARPEVREVLARDVVRGQDVQDGDADERREEDVVDVAVSVVGSSENDLSRL